MTDLGPFSPVMGAATRLRDLAMTNDPFVTIIEATCGTQDNTSCLVETFAALPVAATLLWQLPFLCSRSVRISAANVPFELGLYGRWPWVLTVTASLLKAAVFLYPVVAQFATGNTNHLEMGTIVSLCALCAIWLLHTVALGRRWCRAEPVPDYLMNWYLVVLASELGVASQRIMEWRAYPDDSELLTLDVAAVTSAALCCVFALPAFVALILAGCRTRRASRHPSSQGLLLRRTGDRASLLSSPSSSRRSFGTSGGSLSSPLLSPGSKGWEGAAAAAFLVSGAPVDRATFWSRATFWWMNSLMAAGYRKPLETGDVPPLAWEDEATQVQAAFLRAWRGVLKTGGCCGGGARRSANAGTKGLGRGSRRRRGCAGWAADALCCCGRRRGVNLASGGSDLEGADLLAQSGDLDPEGGGAEEAPGGGREASRVSSSPPTPSLNRVLISAFGPTFGTAVLFKLTFDTVQFAGPVLLSGIIQFLQDSASGSDGEGGEAPPLWRGLAYTGLLLLSSLLQTLLLHAYFFRSFKAGQHMRSAVIVAVYDKALRLSLTARQGQSVGTITNLMSTDAKRLQDLSSYLLTIISGPYTIAIAILLLWQQIGVSVMGGVAVMLLFLPLNGLIARWSKRLQAALMKIKDSRVSLTNEALMGIRLIKLNAWEDAFLQRINAIREEELARLRTYVYVQQVATVLWTGLPLLVMLATFAMYTLLNGAPPNAAQLFTSVSLFNLLRFPMSMIPSVINNVVEAQVSVRRLEDFFKAEELEKDAVIRLPPLSSAYGSQDGGSLTPGSPAPGTFALFSAATAGAPGGGLSSIQEQEGPAPHHPNSHHPVGAPERKQSRGGRPFSPLHLAHGRSFAQVGRETSRLDIGLDELAIDLGEAEAGGTQAEGAGPRGEGSPSRRGSRASRAASNGHGGTAPPGLASHSYQRGGGGYNGTSSAPEVPPPYGPTPNSLAGRRVSRQVDILVERASFSWAGPAQPQSKSQDSRSCCRRRKGQGGAPGGPPVSSSTSSALDPVRPVLHDVSFTVRHGSMCFVVGGVGSGKSGLCHALLGEMHRMSGTVALRGRVAYVPQAPFILNATLRDNILFGRPFEEARYAATLAACALGPDIAILDGGDATEIGEKGINLSGGQKARVSLARAVYADADVYIIDDALSAVDAHVGQIIFTQCFQGLLAGKTRFLVTHGLQYIVGALDVLVIADGTIVERGSYEELVGQRRGAVLCSLMASFDAETTQSLATATGTTTSAAAAASVAAAAAAAAASPSPGSPVLRAMPAVTTTGAAASLALGSAASPASPLMAPPRSSGGGAPSANGGGGNGAAGKRGGAAALRATEQESLLQKPSRPGNEPQEGGGGVGGVLGLIRSLARGKQTTAETRVRGRVSASVYASYVRAIGGWAITLLLLSLFTVFQAATIGTSAYLSYWDSQVTPETTREDNMGYLGVYAAISGASLLVLIVLRIAFTVAGIRAARHMHAALLQALLRTPISFMDTTPLGRVLNRCSQDIFVIDEQFPSTLSSFLMTLLSVLGTIALIGVVTPWFMVGVLPMGVAYLYIQRYYVTTSRELQRLDSISRSPIYAHFSETLQGTPVIRAFGDAPRFLARNAAMLDTNQRAYFANTSANRWLAVRLETLGALVVTSSALFAVLGRDSTNPAFPALAGLSISTALAVTQSLNWFTRMISDCEVQAVSVERVQEYANLAGERGPRPEEQVFPPADWPATGAVVIRNLKLKYRATTPYVLHGVSASIKPAERIGIAGRTGAGKSSFISALFLMADVQEGDVFIDGIDIKRVALATLRSRLTIIPQDPVLFSGSLRRSLDVLGQHSDDALWAALGTVSMVEAVRGLPRGLDSPVADGGSNFSAGQRALLCVARALLRRSKLIVLDEASASVDALSDVALQKAFRTEFKDATVLTIAHRVHTILDSDRVMILRAGRVVEFDAPQALLRNPEGEFAGLVRESHAQAAGGPSPSPSSSEAKFEAQS